MRFTLPCFVELECEFCRGQGLLGGELSAMIPMFCGLYLYRLCDLAVERKSLSKFY